jgi:hypothetical protein
MAKPSRGGRRIGSTRKTVDDLKAEVLRLVGSGLNVKQSLEAVGRARPTYEGWRRTDPAWAGQVDAARQAAGAKLKGDYADLHTVPDFPQFCAEYLNQPLSPHQLQWFDMLEGREPRDLHPAMEYEPGSPTRLMVNTPPGHAKALALDTPLPTPTGWTTMGDVQPGDWLLGADGQPVLVEAVSPVFTGNDCYVVEFQSGEKITADAGHLWQVKDLTFAGWWSGRVRVMTTQQLVQAMEGHVYSMDLPDPADLPPVHAEALPADYPTLDTIMSITPTATVPTQCVVVASDDHLFLAGRQMLPTHNSTTITTNYAVWRICKNPAIRIIIVSKAQRLAEQFLLQIKERLTSPQYPRISVELAPPGGWDNDSAKWTSNMFYVNAQARDAESKDPTVQALGIRGQVYGSRADLVILDDTVDTVNVAEYEKQIVWVLSMVASRLTPKSGRLLVIGTRIASQDLYSELRDPMRYHSGTSPWTYLKQPAVLEFADDPKDWVTLWPKATVGFDPDQDPDTNGLYDRWDGPTLADVRAGLPPAEWSRVYQQQHVAENSVFPVEDVHGCVGGYMCGALSDSTFGRAGGTDGLFLVAGLDPALSGHTAAVLMGVDRRNGHRWVIDLFNKQGCSPEDIRDLIKRWTDKHAINEWRIEKNAFQGFLTGDRDIQTFLASRGVVLTDHYTGQSNKFDAEFGVAAMANLFTQRLIHLPCVQGQGVGEPAKQIVEQLITWTPTGRNRSRKHHHDMVMALWFAELRAQEYVATQHGGLFMDNKFATRGNLARRQLISIA